MHTSISHSDRQFLDRLHREGAAGVQQLCRALGVTATAVRHRLSRLEAYGYVEKVAVPQGRGRPPHAYSVTEAGQKQLGDNYAGLASSLWRVVTDLDDPGLRNTVLSRLRGTLAEEYAARVNANDLRDRIGQLRDVLEERGFDVELRPGEAAGELPVLRENNCPYQDVASRDPTICELEQAVFSDVLGARVELTACCRSGHACCEFEVAGNRNS